MFPVQESPESRGASPTTSNMLGIAGMTSREAFLPRKLSTDYLSSVPRSLLHPQTPPDSTSASPIVKPEGSFSAALSNISRECSPLPRLTRFNSYSNPPPIKLPSLREFDQGVDAIARSYGSTRSWTPPSPLSSLPPPSPLSSLRRGSILPQPLPSMLAFSIHEPAYPNYAISSDFCPSRLDGYPSPPPDSEGRHINQKYTQEEGDFIIYAWHDRKLKWQRIKQEFADRFGRTPERTVQGLQAWYYRMNQRIPVWDRDGNLIFDNDDDLEPRHVSIKCRERDSQDRPMEPMGLAQRYPDRAVFYDWVDDETKMKCMDWAKKRLHQLRDRRERRRRKEQRRLKM
ncbi:hypothetical protein MKX07_005569 [Trichoderma sp. CBMAI-0711]|nr:hypothetical protein MKX07_005569 [Trichoderma sp. CBMAI-0711]